MSHPLSTAPAAPTGDEPIRVACAGELICLAAAWARRHPDDGALVVLLDANHRVVALVPADGGEAGLAELVGRVCEHNLAQVSALALVVTRSGPPPYDRPDDELRWEELQATCRRHRVRLLDWLVVGGGRWTFSVAEHAPTPAAWGRPRPIPPGHLDALREVVAALRTADGERGPEAPPLVAHVRGCVDDPGSWQLLAAPLGSSSPADALMGFSAPAEWCAIGVAAGGWAAPAACDGDLELGRAGDIPPSAHPDAVRVRTTTVISRLGGEVTVLAWPDGREAQLTEPAIGRIPEAMRCALGVANPPPPAPTDVLFCAAWLEAVVAEGRRGGRLSWRRAAALYPAVQLLAAEGGRASLSVAGVVEAARALGRVWGWDGVRRWVTNGWLPGIVDANLAAWMDDGMLARTLLSAFPPLAELLAAAADRTTLAAHRRITQVLVEVLGEGALERW